jgi:hypothetical protein
MISTDTAVDFPLSEGQGKPYFHLKTGDMGAAETYPITLPSVTIRLCALYCQPCPGIGLGNYYGVITGIPSISVTP